MKIKNLVDRTGDTWIRDTDGTYRTENGSLVGWPLQRVIEVWEAKTRKPGVIRRFLNGHRTAEKVFILVAVLVAIGMFATAVVAAAI